MTSAHFAFLSSRRTTARPQPSAPALSASESPSRRAPDRPQRLRRAYTASVNGDSTRIIPLGGLGEVGKNMTVIESGDSLVVIDAGLAFPRYEHLGVALVLLDFAFMRARKHMRRAVLLAQG